MNIPRKSMVACAVILMACALFVSGCDRIESWLHPNRCALSGRLIHPGMGAVVQVEGKDAPVKACCLRCAINYARETGKKLRVLSVTDYVSRKPTSPGTAVYLSGSGITPCAGPRVDAPATRRESSMQVWDRCMPSLIAFADREDARLAQEEEGGILQTFEELTKDTNLVSAE